MFRPRLRNTNTLYVARRTAYSYVTRSMCRIIIFIYSNNITPSVAPQQSALSCQFQFSVRTRFEGFSSHSCGVRLEYLYVTMRWDYLIPFVYHVLSEGLSSKTWGSYACNNNLLGLFVSYHLDIECSDLNRLSSRRHCASRIKFSQTFLIYSSWGVYEHI